MFLPSVMYGADPEAFFTRNGVIIGSEKIIPATGLYNRAVVMDGVQVEFNPRASFNKMDIANSLKIAFNALAIHLKDTKDVKVVFNSVVDVTKDELDTLSPTARTFGCAPSQNIYGKNPICVDPTTYLKRAAGGHVHLGLTPPVYAATGYIDERVRLIPILDIILGNTCVLIDREPGQEERRKYYGRAGEFRLPKHGVEYRTPSNFWLKHVVLSDLVFALAQGAVGILAESLMAEHDHMGSALRRTGYEQLEDKLVELVDIDKFVRAINENNVDLAWENWDTIKPFLVAHPIPIFYDEVALEKFERFAKIVQKKGLNHFFPEDPMEFWCNLKEPWQGWAQFSQRIK